MVLLRPEAVLTLPAVAIEIDGMLDEKALLALPK